MTEADEKLALFHGGQHAQNQKIAVLRERKRVLRRTVLEQDNALQAAELRRSEHELALLDDQLEEERDHLTVMHLQAAAQMQDANTLLRESTEAVHVAEAALRSAINRRVPLPPGQEPGDLDARLDELLTPASVPQPPAETHQEETLVRRWLSLAEYAYAIGIPHSTLRRYVRSCLASGNEYPFEGGAANKRNPWFQPLSEILETFGPRKRRFGFDALDLSRYTPTQIRRMKEFMSSSSSSSSSPPHEDHA